MKRITILLFLFFYCNISFSQKIVVSNKQWEGTNYNLSKPYNSKFRKTTKKIEGIEYRELTFKVDGGWFEGSNQFYREDDNKVYRLYEGEEKVILDFTLNVGDTMRLSNDVGLEYDFVPYRTTDTIIQNKFRRKIEMRGYPVTWTTSNPEKHVWIEGVGDLGFFFGNGEVYNNLKASPVYCVKDGYYIYGSLIFCPNFVLITDIEEEELKPNFYYDSKLKQIHIQKENIQQIDLYSITGVKINSYEVYPSRNVIDLSSIYEPLCVIVSFDGKTYESKILKI